MRSTVNGHYFHSHINSIEFYMPKYMEELFIESSPNIPFKNVDFLAIHLSLMKWAIISVLKNIFAYIVSDCMISNYYSMCLNPFLLFFRSVFMHSHTNQSLIYIYQQSFLAY